MNLNELSRTFQTVLVIDWPDKGVPETLARAGLRVVVRGGPGPDDFSAYELIDGEIVIRRTGGPPERADLVYSYRPLSELPDIVASAVKLGAKAIWTQSGFSAAGVKDRKGCWLSAEDLQLARGLVESAGLRHIHEPYIADR